MVYRVGIVGLRRGVGPGQVFELMPDCKVVAICDADEEVLKHRHAQFPEANPFADYNEMLGEGLDIVFVASPVPKHRDHTVAALEAGAHVLQEVTLGNSIEECRDILAAVGAHSRQKFMLAENCCYWGHVMAWRELFAQGAIGEFMYGEAEYVHDVGCLLCDKNGHPTWRADLPPVHYCTHSLGPLLMITRERCITACGMHTGAKLEPQLGHIDIEVGIFQTSNGGVIKILTAFGIVREPMFHYYSVYGTKGCLETSRPPAPLKTNVYLERVPHLNGMIQMPLSQNVPGAPREATVGGHGTAEYYMVRDFMESVRNDTKPPIDIYAALDMALPGLCAHESAISGGQPVAVPDWR